jgi:hypothetical protein
MTHTESKGKMLSKKRIQVRLSSKLEKNLWAYSAVAGAAGVGILACPQAVQAKIVYTPAHVAVSDGGFTLDLNHDGIADFYIVNGGAASVGGSLRVSYLDVCHIPQNGASHQCVQSSSSIQPNKDNTVRILSSGAAALPAGAKIAYGEKFQVPGQAAGMLGRVFYSGSNTAQKWEGPWANGGKGTNNRYLGFKFKINGEFHYGWARLSVTTIQHHGYTALLTGYAYETVANKGIVAGQTSGADEVSAINPDSPTIDAKASYPQSSLGMLGLGAAGLSIWRREENSSN